MTAHLDLRTLANDVLRVMHERGLSTRTAAAEVGISHNTVARLTSRAHSVSLDNFFRVIVWAGLSADGYIQGRPYAHTHSETDD